MAWSSEHRLFFFFQAEDGIRDYKVTGVQTCALPISFDYVHPDDIAIVGEALARAIHNPGSPQAAQFRFRAQDGAWRVLEAVGQARLDPDGSAQLIVNARDVTERRRQERALRENKERLRTVIAGAPLVLFALDRDGVFTMVEGRGGRAVRGRAPPHPRRPGVRRFR